MYASASEWGREGQERSGDGSGGLPCRSMQWLAVNGFSCSALVTPGLIAVASDGGGQMALDFHIETSWRGGDGFIMFNDFKVKLKTGTSSRQEHWRFGRHLSPPARCTRASLVHEMHCSQVWTYYVKHPKNRPHSALFTKVLSHYVK